MREIAAQKITEVVKKLCIEANTYLPQDLKTRIEDSYDMEPWPQAKEILERIIENYKIADEKASPHLPGYRRCLRVRYHRPRSPRPGRPGRGHP